MTHVLEIEKKFIVTGKIDTFLQESTYDTQLRIDDLYLDTESGLYYQKGVFIRIRNGQSLDIKFNPAHLNQNVVEYSIECHEYNLALPFTEGAAETLRAIQQYIDIQSAVQLEEFIKVNQLCELVRIDKTRTQYIREGILVAYDEIPGIGTLIEFEMQEATEVEKVELWTQNLPVKPMKTGVVEFAVQQAKPRLYPKGKYYDPQLV